MNIISRHDDFDFRMEPQEYIAIHEQFIKADLVETAVLQFAQFGNVADIPEELIKYMTTTPNWDFQLHGWEHSHYNEMHYSFILRDMAAAIHFCEKHFKKTPTIWFPPWNCLSIEMEKVAERLNLKIDNESYDIQKFIREVRGGTYSGHSFYFHGWKKKERDALPEAIELVKWLKNLPK